MPQTVVIVSPVLIVTWIVGQFAFGLTLFAVAALVIAAGALVGVIAFSALGKEPADGAVMVGSMFLYALAFSLALAAIGFVIGIFAYMGAEDKVHGGFDFMAGPKIGAGIGVLLGLVTGLQDGMKQYFQNTDRETVEGGRPSAQGGTVYDLPNGGGVYRLQPDGSAIVVTGPLKGRSFKDARSARSAAAEI